MTGIEAVKKRDKLHMSNDVYGTVRGFRSCAQHCTHCKQRRQLKLFSHGPLEYIDMGVLEALPKTKKGNNFFGRDYRPLL